VPTSLLAQVDSSVGGKTAVNHHLGKNLIGAFYQPSLVLIDKTTLKTLPDRELAAGMAEVIKYGIIKDRRFFSKLEESLDITNNMLAKCCFIKAKVVEKDEKEKGLRMILNFGHTIGHALEADTKYQHYLHGEAVALGMVAAGYISYRVGLIDIKELNRIKDLIAQAKLPTAIDYKYSFSNIKKIMEKDKKVANGKVNFVLIEKIGRTVIRDDISWELVKDSLKYLKNG
jgi:3-dehydroquinate synthase